MADFWCKRCDNHARLECLDETCPWRTESEIATLRTQLSQAQEQLERVTGERDAAREQRDKRHYNEISLTQDLRRERERCQEKSDALRLARSQFRTVDDLNGVLLKENETLTAQIAELREALEPFAEIAGNFPEYGVYEDNLTVECELHVNRQYRAMLGTEDFRKARSVLAKDEGETNG